MCILQPDNTEFIIAGDRVKVHSTAECNPQ